MMMYEHATTYAFAVFRPVKCTVTCKANNNEGTCTCTLLAK